MTARRLIVVPAFAVAVAIVPLLRVAPSAAATFMPFAFASDGDVLSLRAAFDAANANTEADVIVLQPGQIYELTLCGPAGQEDGNLDGDLDHTAAESLTITGTGTIFNRCPDERVLDGGVGLVAGPLVLDLVTIMGGRSDGSGGGIRSYGPLTVTSSAFYNNVAAGGGGAVAAYGPSDFVDTSIGANVAAGRGGAVGSNQDAAFLRCTLYDNEATEGGAVYTLGPVTFTECTVWDNRARSGGGGLTSLADPLDEVRIINSTFSGNDSSPGEGGVLSTYAAARITSSTLFANIAGAGRGAIVARAGSVVRLGNSIIAGNTGGDCVAGGGTFDSTGNNIDSDASCGLSEDSDRPATDPQLGPLADNGGPITRGFTSTHLPSPTSPALDGGNAMDCPGTDQRGQIRPVDSNGDGVAVCDIGAVEVPDLCPTDPAKTDAGSCGCGVADADVDQPNGTADCKVNGELKARVARAKAIVTALAGRNDPLEAELSTIGESIPVYVEQRIAELSLAEYFDDPGARLAKLALKARKALRLVVRAKARGKLDRARARATKLLDLIDGAVLPQL